MNEFLIDYKIDDTFMNKIIDFSDDVLKKIQYNEGFIRIDIYHKNDKFYLGEFTLTGGWRMYEPILPKYMRLLFS